jgi:hypothetical protein
MVHTQQSLLWEASLTDDLDIFLSKIPYVTTTIISHVDKIFRPIPSNLASHIRQLVDMKNIQRTPLGPKFAHLLDQDALSEVGDFRWVQKLANAQPHGVRTYVWIGILKWIQVGSAPRSLRVTVGAYQVDVSELQDLEAVQLSSVQSTLDETEQAVDTWSRPVARHAAAARK